MRSGRCATSACSMTSARLRPPALRTNVLESSWMRAPEARKTSVEYVEQPCKSALNAVRGMPFKWSLNPYMGCEHRCTFCYVRAFEKRADRPSDDRYVRTIRVKTNIAG